MRAADRRAAARAAVSAPLPLAGYIFNIWNEKEAAARGEAEFEKELVALGIRHIRARAGHPQTNCKLERFHGAIQRKLKWFSGIDELVRWYNYDRPHDSLDRETLETPVRAFVRKMPRSG